MGRLRRLIACTGLLAAALGAASLANPSAIAACSCAAPLPGIGEFRGPDEVALMGQVGVDDGSGTFTFAVERWFHGGHEPIIRMRSDTERLADGSFVRNSCGVSLVAGARLVVGAHRADDVVIPSACAPHAEIDSAEGQRIVAEAEAAFGPGVVPGPPSATGDGVDLASVAIVAVFGIVAAVIAVTLIAVMRRGPGTSA